jgi:hypothetical protein
LAYGQKRPFTGWKHVRTDPEVGGRPHPGDHQRLAEKQMADKSITPRREITGETVSIKTRSTLTFFVLLAILVVVTVLNFFLPQGEVATLLSASQTPKWQLALSGAGMTVVISAFLAAVAED